MTTTSPSAAPPHGLSTRCKIVGIVDGDTLDVEVIRRVRVRLLDLYAPESRTKDAAEKKKGIAAKEHLRAVADGRDATLFIPGSVEFQNVTTLGRVLGQVWLDGERESLAEMMVRAGHASKEKL